MQRDINLAFAVAVIIYVMNQKKVYEITNRFFSNSIDELEMPTQKGILMHALFAGILFYVMIAMVN